MLTQLLGSLLGVCVLAKLALVLGCVADGSAAGLRTPWAVPALLLEDLAVVLALGLFGGLLSVALRRLGPVGRRVLQLAGWTLYGLGCVYTVANVPVARVCSTPLTYPMLPAAGGALSDSLALYVTAGNVGAVLSLLLAAVVLPLALRRVRLSSGLRLRLLAVALGVLALGVLARGHVDSRGLHRSALWTLVRTATYQLSSRSADRVVTTPPPRLPALPLPPELEAQAEPSVASVPPLDLSSLRGIAKGRSVLWVVLESTAAQYLQPFGAAQDPMPRLSLLARQALRFPHTYAVYPESIKGLFASLCSTAPAAHTPATRYTQQRLPCAGLASQFAAAGYQTALFHSGWFLYLGMRGIVEARGFGQLQDAGTIAGQYGTSFGVDEQATVQRLLQYVDAQPAGQPFFAMYLPIAGHHPYYSPGPLQRPQPFAGRDDLSRYQNDLALGDVALGTLLDGLSARGLLSQMLVVVSGDHGEAFGQHPGNLAHSLFLYEENVRVPLLIVPPRDTVPSTAPPPGSQAGQVASLLDVAPTLLDLCGLPIPARYQGHSLLSPEATSESAVARFLTDHAVWQVGLRQGRYKFIYDIEADRGQLYDLWADPQEQHNLSQQQPQRYQAYREDVLGFSARQRAWVAGAGE